MIDWTFRHVPDSADAVYLAGNGFRVAAAVEELEETIGRPVLTATQVLMWSLLALVGATFPFGDMVGRSRAGPCSAI
jgi:maleate isomerase